MAPVSEFSPPTETRAQGKEAALSNVTPTCDLHCMVVTEQKPFPRKRVLDNFNRVIHCPSLSRKELGKACLEKFQFMK